MADSKRPKEKPTLQSVHHYEDAGDRAPGEPPLGTKTLRMAAVTPGKPAPPDRATAPADGRGIELVVVDETQHRGSERKPWRAAEIWTKRRVYGLDSSFRCFDILDRETGRPDGTNELLGARLGGGRLRAGESVRFSYPYPLPGMEAMFMKGKKHGYTSPVERMIVRVRVLHTAAGETAPTWDEIASRWSEPPPAR